MDPTTGGLVGVDGGYLTPAILPGAQAALQDTKLTASDGVLRRGGLPFRAIGVNAHNLFEDLLKSGTRYIADLASIAASGVRVIRISAVPLSTADWGTYVGTVGGSPVSTYIPALRTFLDECAKNGISCIVSLLWNHFRVSAVVSSTEADFATANSKSRKYCVDFSQVIVRNFYDHPAVAAWGIGNEWSNYAFASKFLTSAATSAVSITAAANNGSGLIRLTASGHAVPSGFTFPVKVRSVGGTIEANGDWRATYVSATQVDLVGSTFSTAYTSGGTIEIDHKLSCIESINEVVSAIRKYDPQRAIVAPTGMQSWFLAGDFKTYIKEVMDYTGNCDTFALHYYPDIWSDESNAHSFVGEDQKAGPVFLSALRAEALARRKAVIVEECNAQFDNPAGSLAQTTYNQCIAAGFELILDWGWYADPADVGLPNLKTTRNAVMSSILTTNQSLATDQAIRPVVSIYPAIGSFNAPATCFIGTAATNNNIRVANSTEWQPDSAGEFVISYWLKKNRKLSANTRILSCNEAAAGFLITAASGGSEDSTLFQMALGGSQRGLTLAPPRPYLPYEWHHFCFYWDGAQQIHVWIDGVYSFRENLASLWTYTPTAIRSLYFGANADGSTSSAVSLCDVMIGKGQTPTTESVYQYVINGAVPFWAEHRWKLNGDAVDSLGGLNGILGAGATFGASGLGIG